jgi:HEAT repeat protein
MPRSIRIGIALLWMLQLTPCVLAEDAFGNDRSVEEWKTRTQPKFAFFDRREAIYALGFIAERRLKAQQVATVEAEIVPTLAGLLHDHDPEIRRAAVESFWGIHAASKSAVGPLVELLGDESPYIRAQAAGNLVGIKPDEADRVIPVLVEVLKQSKHDRAQYAANILASVQPGGPKSLIAMLDDQNPVLRSTATKALRSTDITELKLATLKTLLQDEVADVRADAVYLISRINPPTREAVSAILPLLHDKHSAVQTEVLKALAEMHADPEQSLPEMVTLAGDPGWNVRDALAASLAGMGPNAVPTLIKLLDDEINVISVHAADSLGQLGPAANGAAPALKRHLVDYQGQGINSHTRNVSRAAAKALAKILNDQHYLENLPAPPMDGGK